MDNRAATLAKITGMAKSMRKKALDIALEAGAKSSHLGGGLSMMEITATLYGAIMKHAPGNPQWADRDRFILSKGHGVLGYYTALSEIGLLSEQDLLSFEKTGSFLLGHPVMNRARGIDFSTGSLGMGLGLGIGVALAGRKRGKDYRVFVLMGDGECNEGSVWEGALSGAHLELDRLTVIVDRNGLQQTGTNDQILKTGDMAAKWASFGWNAVEVDGHDVCQLFDALNAAPQPGKPTAIIARTTKGKGFSFTENNNDWHHNVLTRSQYDLALEELNA